MHPPNNNLTKTIHSYSNYDFNSNTGTYETNRDVLLTKQNQRASDNATISSVTYNVNSIGQRTSRTTTDAANATSTAQWGYNATGEKPRRLVGVLDRREVPCLEEVSSSEAAANQLTKADHSDTAQNGTYNYDGNPINAQSHPQSSTSNPASQNGYVTGYSYVDNSPKYSDKVALPKARRKKTKKTPVTKGEGKKRKFAYHETGTDYYRSDLTEASYTNPSTIALTKEILGECPYGSMVLVDDVGWFVVESHAGAGTKSDPRFGLWMGGATEPEMKAMTGTRCVRCFKNGDVPTDEQKAVKGSAIWLYKTWSDEAHLKVIRKGLVTESKSNWKWEEIYVDGKLVM